MPFLKKLGLFTLAGTMLLTGCKTVQEGTSRFTVSQTSNASSTDSSSVSLSASSSQAKPTPVTGTVNALTGESISTQLVNQRPLAVAIDNVKQALPQNGIGQADLVIESEASGQITRLLAFYTDWDSLSKVGPIRELTPCLADLAQAFDAVPLHTESKTTLAASTLKSRNYSTLNANYYTAGVLADRDETLKATRSVEHTLVSSGALAKAVAEDIGLRTTYRDDAPDCWFSFTSTAITPAQYRARAVFLNYGMNAQYKYISDKGVYQRYVSGAPQTDLNNGNTVEVKNVLVLFAKQTVNAETKEVIVDFASGEGYYISQGGAEQIYWQRGRNETDKLMLYDLQGSELVLNAGKSWITIMPTTAKSGVSWSEIGG